jgi:adenylylsulfate reductase subunit B
MWTIRFRNGTLKRFKFPIRTTLEGSADPFGGKPEADMAQITDDKVLFTGGLHSCDMSQFIAS